MNVPLILTILAICSVETDLRNINNLEDGGSPSYGICQIKMVAAKQVRPKITIKELEDVNTNISVAKEFYLWQTKRYAKEYCAISAYNAGHCSNKNFAYVKKVRRRRSSLIAEKNLLFRLRRLNLSKQLQNQLQDARRFETGDKSQDLRYAESDG